MTAFTQNIIYLCTHCGEKCTGKYCNTCKTAEGRKKVTEGNHQIEIERQCALANTADGQKK